MPETPPPAAPTIPSPGKWTDFAFKVLSILVVSLCLWGV